MKWPSFYWITAIFYALFIFFLSIFALPLGERLGGHPFYEWALFAACFLFAATSFFLLWKTRKKITLPKWLAFAATAGIYVFFYFHLKFPIEEIHLINFAILCFLLKKAMENSGSQRHIYWKAVSLAVLAGCFDEFVQKFVPGRFADWHDVGLCLIGALLGAGLARLIL